MTEQIFTTNSNSNLIVQSNPTIQFNNGMVLWLAKKGETYELKPGEWELITQMNQLASTMSSLHRFKYIPMTDAEVEKAVKEGFWRAITNWFKGK